MNSIIKTCAAAAVAMTLAPAAATAGGTSANAGANAGAAAVAGGNNTSDGGTWIGAASPGAAYCANSIAVGPIGGSWTMRSCVALDITEQGGRMATLSRAEIRAVQLKALEDVGYKFKYETTTQPTTTSRSAAPATSPRPAPRHEPVTFSVNGGKVKLTSQEHLAAFHGCQTLQVQGQKVKKSGC